MRRPCFVGLSWVHVQECTEMECAAATSGPDSGLGHSLAQARLAQSAERKTLNLVVVGSSPTVGVGSTLSSCDGDSFVGGGRGFEPHRMVTVPLRCAPRCVTCHISLVFR